MDQFKTYQMRLAVASMLLTFSMACGGAKTGQEADGGIETVLEVEDHKVPCSGEGRFLCLLTREEGTTEYFTTSGDIEGFSFEWGTSQKIKVRSETIVDPPADGASNRLILLGTIWTQLSPADQRFTLDLIPGDIRGSKSTGFTLLDLQNVKCLDEQICQEIEASVSKSKYSIEFLHDSPRGTLLAVRVF